MLPRHSLPSARRLLLAAYLTAVASSLVSTALTYVYVGAGARELNPVMVALIDGLGLWLALLLRTLVIVGCYWGYALLASGGFRSAVAFAWSGATVHVMDAGHDVHVALAAGPVGDPGTSIAALLLVCLAVGLLLRPPLPAETMLEEEWSRR